MSGSLDSRRRARSFMDSAFLLKTRARRAWYWAVTIILILSAGGFGQSTATSSVDLEQRLETLRAKLPGLKSRIDAVRARGEDVSYPMVPYTVMANFVDFTAEDLKTFTPDG